MASVTIRNLPDDTHRALKQRAARHGRSTEAEIRAILQDAAHPEGRLRLGSALRDLSRGAGLSDDEAAIMQAARDQLPANPIDLS